MDRISKIVVLPGDGIGPEVTTEAVKVVKSTGLDCEIQEHSVGGEEYLKTGLSLSSDAIDAINESDAVLFGAVGHDLVPDEIARQPLVYLRMEKSTFGASKVVKLMDQYVALQIDVTDPADKNTSAVQKRLGVYGPPALLFFNKQGQRIKSMDFYGYKDADEFATHIKQAL